MEEFAAAVELHDGDDVDHNKELEINFKTLKIIANIYDSSPYPLLLASLIRNLLGRPDGIIWLPEYEVLVVSDVK